MAEITAACGRKILVSNSDVEWLSRWSWILYGNETKGVYATRVTIRSGSRSSIQMHRLIMNAGEGELVDHINGDTLDNRRENLRIATVAQNRMNQQRAFGRSGYKGVVWNRSSRKWQAQIGHNGRSYYLGVFDDPQDAARAYDTAALERFGTFARTNAMLGLISLEEK